MPCLRRAASLAYTDADEDAERLLSFSDSAVPAEGDEWVETHSGRKASQHAGAPGIIEDEIPDLDEGHVNTTAAAMANLSISKGQSTTVPDLADLDEIPDMEEELEGERDGESTRPRQRLESRRGGVEVVEGKTADGMTPGWG